MKCSINSIMNKKVITTISVISLLLSITHPVSALSIEEQKACLAKLPKTATLAEKIVAKNKCSHDARSSGKGTLTDVRNQINFAKELTKYPKYIEGSITPNNPDMLKQEQAIRDEYHTYFIPWLSMQIEPLKTLNDKLMKDIDSSTKYTSDEKTGIKKKVSDKITKVVYDSTKILKKYDTRKYGDFWFDMAYTSKQFKELRDDPLIQFKPISLNTEQSTEQNKAKQVKNYKN